jgi:hypothetical protein
VETKLASDLLHMAFGGALADEQLDRDLAVREALGDELSHLSLAAGQIRRPHVDLAERITRPRRTGSRSGKTGTENR